MASTLRLGLRQVHSVIIDVAATVEEGLDVLGGVVEYCHAQGGEVHEGDAWHPGNSGAVENLNILRKTQSLDE